MNKKISVFIIVIMCLLISSCDKKEGEFISKSRYVTPAMIETMKEEIKKTPNEAEKTENETEAANKEVTETATAIETETVSTKFDNINDDTTTEQVSDKINPVPKAATESEKPSKTYETTVNDVSVVSNSSDEVTDENIVYVTENGKKYHKKPSCSNMKSPKQTTKQAAEKMGKTYCKKCYK